MTSFIITSFIINYSIDTFDITNNNNIQKMMMGVIIDDLKVRFMLNYFSEI